jgi:catechol 2,3-dioxygenase-like lactoylglutathione lyase family enzyme
MITKIGHITILVRDQDEAILFYTNILGMEKRSDVAMENGFRWVTVAPKDQKLEIVFVLADSPEELARVGNQAADHVFLVLHTDDCRKEAARLQALGVKFLSLPTNQMWGVEAVFQDLYGNVMDLLEPRTMQ